MAWVRGGPELPPSCASREDRESGQPEAGPARSLESLKSQGASGYQSCVSVEIVVHFVLG